MNGLSSIPFLPRYCYTGKIYLKFYLNDAATSAHPTNQIAAFNAYPNSLKCARLNLNHEVESRQSDCGCNHLMAPS
jgi:hypothetical protein